MTTGKILHLNAVAAAQKQAAETMSAQKAGLLAALAAIQKRVLANETVGLVIAEVDAKDLSTIMHTQIQGLMAHRVLLQLAQVATSTVMENMK